MITTLRKKLIKTGTKMIIMESGTNFPQKAD